MESNITDNKPVLVLIHGFLSGSAYWDKQVNELTSIFQLVVVDLPGYGKNTDVLGPDRIIDFANYVLNLLAQQGINKFNLMGHSMGGMIAQEIALQVPEQVERLILYGTGPMGELPGRFEPIEESLAKVQLNGTSEAKYYTVASWFIKGAKAPSFASGLALAEPVSQQTYINGLKAMQNWSSVERLAQIKSHTLVVWGDNDRSYIWSQPYQLWQDILHSNLAVIPNCAHNVHLENTSLFNQVILDFLILEVK